MKKQQGMLDKLVAGDTVTLRVTGDGVILEVRQPAKGALHSLDIPLCNMRRMSAAEQNQYIVDNIVKMAFPGYSTSAEDQEHVEDQERRAKLRNLITELESCLGYWTDDLDTGDYHYVATRLALLRRFSLNITTMMLDMRSLCHMLDDVSLGPVASGRIQNVLRQLDLMDAS